MFTCTYITLSKYSSYLCILHCLSTPHIFSANITKNTTSTVQKDAFNDNARKILRPLLTYEYQFHRGLQERFYKLLSAIRVLKANVR